MIPEAVYREPGFCLMAGENPGKPQLGDRLMSVVGSIVSSSVLPYRQMTSAGSHSTSGREKEEKKEKST